MGNSTTTKRIGRCPLPGLYTKYPHNSRRVAPHFYTGVSLLTMHYARHHWILLMRTLTYVLCLLAWEQRKLPLSYLLASGGTALLSTLHRQIGVLLYGATYKLSAEGGWSY